MQDDLDAAHLLIAEDAMISIVKKQNAEALRLEGVLLVQPEVGGRQRKDAKHENRDVESAGDRAPRGLLRKNGTGRCCFSVIGRSLREVCDG